MASSVTHKQNSTTFSLTEARHIVKDLFQPKPWIYWGDFLTCWAGGLFLLWATPRLSYVIDARSWFFYLIVAASFLGSALLFYRCTIFTHELVHLPRSRFRAFAFAWNLLCGIPFLIPSFTYYTHRSHHQRRLYGTQHDGEYLSLAHGPRYKILLYLAECAVVPIVVVLRFAVLTPISWVIRPFRRWLLRHMSSMVIDPRFIRPQPSRSELRVWRIQEAATVAFVWVVAVEILTGILPWHFLPRAYFMAVTIMFINSIRTLGAHRYSHPRHEMSFVEQLLDSVNYPRKHLTAELWAPLGLRYHALHHLFPSLPYHNLGIAHDRLMDKLPADSLYRMTESPSLLASLKRLWTVAGRNSEPLRTWAHDSPAGRIPTNPAPENPSALETVSRA